MNEPPLRMDNVRIPPLADQARVLDEWETNQSLLEEVSFLKNERDCWRKAFIEVDAAMSRMVMESRLLFRQTRFMLIGTCIIAVAVLILSRWGA